MDQALPLLIALVLIVIAWKVLKGIVKTGVLILIAAIAAWFVFGGMN
jgi:hypothetical protein